MAWYSLIADSIIEDQLIKLGQTDVQIQGPAVDSLIMAMQSMYGRTAPDSGTELNNSGFNKQDWLYFRSKPEFAQIANAAPGSAVSARAAKMSLNLLAKYQARQVPNYKQMFTGISELIGQALGQENTGGEKRAEIRGVGQYNTLEVYLRGFTPEDKKAVNNAAKAFIETKKDANGNYPSWAVWQGKPAPFKLFSVRDDVSSLCAISLYQPEFFQQVTQLLGTRGFNVESLTQYAQQPMSQVATPSDPANPSPQQSNQKRVQARFIPPAGVQVNFPWDPAAVDFIKNGFKSRVWVPDQKAWYMERPAPTELDNLAHFFQGRGYDVNELLRVAEEYKTAAAEGATGSGDQRKPLEVRNVSEQSAFLLAITMPRDQTLRNELQESIKFSFPTFGKQNDITRRDEEVMRTIYQYNNYLFGNFDDFIRFGLLLDARKWDMTNYRNVVAQLMQSGKLKKTRYTGQMDGYQTKDDKGKPINDTEAFYKDLDSVITGQDKKLYPKQKQGIAWLYSRNSAILGDKTGAGKTASLLGAAAMRMKQSGGRTLIITLPATQKQWADEITDWLGEEEGKNVSFNPGANTRWVILTYQDFASTQKMTKEKPPQPIMSPSGAPSVKRPKVQAVLDAINSKTDFTCLLLDEGHMLKNENAAKSMNIAHVTERIPFKWGASATPVANKPQDIHNFLRIIGHSLGKIGNTMFEREFVGAKMNIKNSKDPATKKIQEDAAMRLRKWLTLTGAYLSRSKKAMNPSIPDHNITESEISEDEFDTVAFWNNFKDLLDQYKNPALAISKMIAQRVTLANSKVPYTLQDAYQVLDQADPATGQSLRKKVLIFSCFRDACGNLVNGLKSHLAQTDPQGQVVHIMGNDDRKSVNAAIQAFRTNPNARAMVIASLKGGTGVSLPNTTGDVFMNDFDWTPKVTEQTEGRAYRINNTIPVNTRYKIAKGTPDEVLYKYVRNKIDLSNLIQDIDSELEEKLLVGIDDKELQEKLRQAKFRYDQVEVDLASELNEMMAAHGIHHTPVNPDQLDLDDIEMGDDNAVDPANGIATNGKPNAPTGVDGVDEAGVPNHPNPPKSTANGWYGNAKFAELKSLCGIKE